MDDISEILEMVKINQKLARKFFEIELSILSINNFRELFERLLIEIKAKFGVPYVWFSMINKDETSHLIEILTSSETLKERLNIIDGGTFLDLTGDEMKPVLLDGDLKHFYKLLPQKEKYLIRSIAIIPLILNGEVIGSLNQADYSELRYRPDLDATLLEQFAKVISICLSNITAYEQLRLLAFTDPLTGLLNRRVVDDMLSREFRRAERFSTPLTLIIIDIDGMKATNDIYGHEAGDDLLKYVSSNLKMMCRESDIIARFGGDEFVAILPDTPSEKAYTLMKRLQDFFRTNPLNVEGTPITASISFGIADVADITVIDPRSLLKRADMMLYEAKKSKMAESLDLDLRSYR